MKGSQEYIGPQTFATSGGGGGGGGLIPFNDGGGPGTPGTTQFAVWGFTTTTDASTFFVAPRAGAIHDLAVFVNPQFPGTPPLDVEVLKNGAPVLAVSYVADGSGLANDAGSVVVALGDKIVIRMTLGAGATAITKGVGGSIMFTPS